MPTILFEAFEAVTAPVRVVVPVTAKVLWSATAPEAVNVEHDSAPRLVLVVTANVDWNATAPEAVIVVQAMAPVVSASDDPPIAKLPSLARKALFVAS